MSDTRRGTRGADGTRARGRSRARDDYRPRRARDVPRDLDTGEFQLGRRREKSRPDEDRLLSRLNERGFRLVMVADVAVLLAIQFATMFVRFTLEGRPWPRGPAPQFPYTPTAYVTAFFVLTALHFVMFYFGGLYERDPRLGHPPTLARAASLSFTAILVFTGITFVLGGTGIRPLPNPTINLAVLFVLGSLGVSANRWLARLERRRKQGPPRVLLVGSTSEVDVARRHLREDGARVLVVGEASSVDDLMERVAEVEATDLILLSGDWLDQVYPSAIREFESRDISVLQRVTAKETLYGLEGVREVGGMPFVPLREHTIPMSRVRFKRFLEVLYVLATAPIWVPLLGLLCLYQLVVAGRPIFYWQTRVGQDGRLYEMVKFRTMRVDAEEETGPTLAERDDPRVIPACRWVRATRLDEVPQVYNVLKGEMSLVGPRPERPELTAEYERLIPGYATRYEIPPGITGLAQVHGRYSTDPEYKLGYDLQYLVNWSPLLDLEIIVRTIWVVAARRL